MGEMIPGEAIDMMSQQEDMLRQQQASDERLLGAIEERESQAVGGETDNVNVERATAIEYYLGKPFGNELEGRSQVVSKDVFDTVEWVKPALLRIFAGGDTIAEFQPEGEEDIETSKQESDYVDFVIQRKNPWFMIAHEWFTDGLLTKNAYAMAYWQKKSEPVLETYNGLTQDQLVLIAMDHSVEIVAHNAYQAPLMQGMVVLHNVQVRRVKQYGCAKICVLPPERCLVASDTRGMSVREHSDFFEYWEYKTISSLRSDGFEVEDDISDSGGIEKGVVDEVRDSVTTQSAPGERQQSSDPSMRKVKVRMIWIRNDYDGDGIAELRYVVAVGSTFLANQEVTGIPVGTIVPYPMPHRHIGLSLHDVLSDLQLIKSAMLRAGIDNQYLANNGRYGVDKNVVNLDDMAVSRPGGMVRVNGSPQSAIMPFEHPVTVDGTIAMVEYLDGIRQDRGGVSKPYAGADLDSIKAQPGTIAQLTSAASQKIELIARIFGEGVKELFHIVHEITLQNPTVVEKVELRGKWVTVDPRTWKKRSDMTLTVGMGVGNRQQQVVALQSLLALQEKALGVGLTSLPKIYTALAEYTKALGFASGKQFFDEPQPGEKYQPQPPYQIMVAQIKAQSDVLVQTLKNHTEATLGQMKEEANAARTYFDSVVDTVNNREERMVRMFSEQTDRIQELRLESARAGSKDGTTVRISGLDSVESAVKQASEHAKAAGEAVRIMQEVVAEQSKPKSKRKTVKNMKTGTTYQVEEE
jgi:hypothetical protein